MCCSFRKIISDPSHGFTHSMHSKYKYSSTSIGYQKKGKKKKDSSSTCVRVNEKEKIKRDVDEGERQNDQSCHFEQTTYQ